MYPYDCANKPISMDPYKIFIAMPFEENYDDVYNVLIKGAISKVNEILELNKPEAYYPVRTKDEPSTFEGWNKILTYILSSRMIIGVLDENKSSVFYELGIAHSTQPLSKQVLMASSNYISKSDFDTKDLIHFRYNRDNLSGDIDNFARWIKNSLEKYKIEQENRVKKAKMRLGHEEFRIMRQFGKNRNFVSSANDPTRNLRHELGLLYLCENSLLGLNTGDIDKGKFSYYWTNFGNEVLEYLKIITKEEREKRFPKLPDGFYP